MSSIHSVAVLLALISVASVYSEAASPRDSTPVTAVCDLIRHAASYNKRDVIAIGRLDCSSSLVDTVCFLAEDECDRPIVTNNHRWPTKTLLQIERSSADDPEGNLRPDDPRIADKLASLQKSTKLSSHRQFVLRQGKDGKMTPDYITAPDRWGIVYGRVHFSKKQLQSENDCEGPAGDSCGFYGAPVLIRTSTNAVMALAQDGHSRVDW